MDPLKVYANTLSGANSRKFSADASTCFGSRDWEWIFLFIVIYLKGSFPFGQVVTYTNPFCPGFVSKLRDSSASGGGRGSSNFGLVGTSAGGHLVKAAKDSVSAHNKNNNLVVFREFSPDGTLPAFGGKRFSGAAHITASSDTSSRGDPSYGRGSGEGGSDAGGGGSKHG